MQNQEHYLSEPTLQEPQQHHQKAADPVLSYLTAQIVVCCVLLVLAGAFRLVGGGIFAQIKQEYQSRFCDTTSVSEVVDALRASPSASQTQEKTATITTVMAPPATADEVNDDQLYGDSADDSTAITEQSLLMNTAMESSNRMAVPLRGMVTSPFGYRIHPIYGTRLFHNGVDIAAESGTPIVSALEGRVETAEYSDSYGNYVVVDHGNGLSTLYAHCSRLQVQVGQRVQKGETVALVGSTGMSTGPHLHFEVRNGASYGSDVSPWGYLK